MFGGGADDDGGSVDDDDECVDDDMVSSQKPPFSFFNHCRGIYASQRRMLAAVKLRASVMQMSYSIYILHTSFPSRTLHAWVMMMMMMMMMLTKKMK